MSKLTGIIVLEGADGVGKTTLARELVKKHDAFYIHNGLWPNIWQRHVAAVRLAIKLQEQRLVVIDRLWLSEQIYGQVFRGGPAYDLSARCLDRALLRYGALTVLCVRKNLRRHLEHFEVLKKSRPEKFLNIGRVAQFYYDLFAGNVAHPGETYVDQLVRFQDYGRRLDVVGYDMDQQQPEHLLPTLERRLATLRYKPLDRQFDPSFHNLTGAYAHVPNGLLFVGEGLSPRACPSSPPFFWNDELSAATWLNRELHQLRFNETRGLWLNALGEDANRLLHQLRDHGLTVVALGRVASAALYASGWKPEKVRPIPHPQWVRRFQTRSPEIYREQLREAIS